MNEKERLSCLSKSACLLDDEARVIEKEISFDNSCCKDAKAFSVNENDKDFTLFASNFLNPFSIRLMLKDFVLVPSKIRTPSSVNDNDKEPVLSPSQTLSPFSLKDILRLFSLSASKILDGVSDNVNDCDLVLFASNCLESESARVIGKDKV